MDIDNNSYGAYEFSEACQAHKLSIMVGLEIGLEVIKTNSLRMIALSAKGYQESLMKMSTVKMMGSNWGGCRSTP